MQIMFALRVQPPLARAIVLAGLALLSAATAASAQATEGIAILNDPAVASYRLTVEKLEPFITTVHTVDAIGETDEIPALDDLGDDATLDEVVAALESEPRFREAFEETGLSAREYLTFSFALVNAMFGSLAVTMGGESALDEIDDEVLRENIRFYIEHEERFERLGEEKDG